MLQLLLLHFHASYVADSISILPLQGLLWHALQQVLQPLLQLFTLGHAALTLALRAADLHKCVTIGHSQSSYKCDEFLVHTLLYWP